MASTMGMLGALFLKDCQACSAVEERVFTDSWTGLELCSECLSAVIDHVTMSPASEGDNLKEELRARTDFGDDEEDDDE